MLERMKAGEFTSVREAAREAGIIKNVSLVNQIVRLWEKATLEERQAIRQRLAIDADERHEGKARTTSPYGHALRVFVCLPVSTVFAHSINRIKGLECVNRPTCGCSYFHSHNGVLQFPCSSTSHS